MKLYVVIAHYQGNRDKHSYLLGVYSNKDDAEQASLNEEEFRRGKYICEITEVMLDRMVDEYRHVIKWLRPISSHEPIQQWNFTG